MSYFKDKNKSAYYSISSVVVYKILWNETYHINTEGIDSFRILV